MADVSIKYKGSEIATLDASGTKTLKTKTTYCEDDITVEYTDTGTEKPTQEKAVTITENGTTEVLPDDGKALSKVTVTVNVAGEVLEEYDGTITIV